MTKDMKSLSEDAALAATCQQARSAFAAYNAAVEAGAAPDALEGIRRREVALLALVRSTPAKSPEGIAEKATVAALHDGHMSALSILLSIARDATEIIEAKMSF